MDWNARNKIEEFIGTALMMLYWVMVVPWIWLYYKLKEKKNGNMRSK